MRRRACLILVINLCFNPYSRKLEEVQKKNPETLLAHLSGKTETRPSVPHWTFQALMPTSKELETQYYQAIRRKYFEVKDPFVISDITQKDLIDYSKK
jgi:hypothetical protein